MYSSGRKIKEDEGEENFWGRDEDGFPKPSSGVWPLCPCCRSDKTMIKSYRYHIDGEKTIYYACEIAMACSHCHHIWWHDIKVNKGEWHGGLYSRRKERLF